MKPIQYFIALTLGAACLILSIYVYSVGQSTRQLRLDAQKQQSEINRGVASQQGGTNLLTDMASASVANEKIRTVLSNNGVTVNVNDKNSNAAPNSSPSSK